MEKGIIKESERALSLLTDIDKLESAPSGRKYKVSRFARNEREERIKEEKRRQQEEQGIAQQGEKTYLSDTSDHDER